MRTSRYNPRGFYKNQSRINQNIALPEKHQMPNNIPTSLTPDQWDVCVIGVGRVGLPLSLSLIEVGLKVIGLDTDKSLRDTVNAGEMPFDEPGYDELIKRGTFQITDDPTVITQCDTLIITVGTPLHSHIEADLHQVQQVLNEIKEHLHPGHFICLRSTISPGTTTFVKQWLEQKTPLKVGTDLKLAFCPERIAEGHAYKELRTLPQIVGAEDLVSWQAASKLFSRLAPEVMRIDFVSAELLKLFTNATRYIHFAVANQFALIADTFGADIHLIQQLANHKYPRTKIAAPGLTGGACLRKDFGMINEWTPYSDLLLTAWKINEYVPMFLVQHQIKRESLSNKTVAVLGYTFKYDTDDTRDSLVPKLVRYIQRQTPKEIRISDHNLPDPIPDAGNGELKNWSADEACRDSDCVFVAINHTGYREVLERLAMTHPQISIVDIWNVGNLTKIFYKAEELTDKAQRRASAI